MLTAFDTTKSQITLLLVVNARLVVSSKRSGSRGINDTESYM